MKKFSCLGIAALVIALAVSAHADVPQPVQRAFDGQVVIADDPVQHLRGSAGAMIDALERARQLELEPSYVQYETAHWQFSFIAFLSRAPRVSELSLDVYRADDGAYVTSERLLGIDPGLRILVGEASLSEDDELARGERYRVELTGVVRGREVSFASAALTLR